ncbi:hypothetical protein [Bradyrhizobium sp. Ai1a-2]|uniref:hypothetical protein n=1 Tax=Bradyrhizobium sp. Ai1a-2 TaxID=196490 RepID=UPI001267FD7F|nr:hypothetical protein [Bradyrhizobium sp. Ai1a-2]
MSLYVFQSPALSTDAPMVISGRQPHDTYVGKTWQNRKPPRERRSHVYIPKASTTLSEFVSRSSRVVFSQLKFLQWAFSALVEAIEVRPDLPLYELSCAQLH